MSEIVITEGVHGQWYYHISDKQTPQKALCGAATMITSMTFETWGFVGHLKERYCKKCEALLFENCIVEPFVK